MDKTNFKSFLSLREGMYVVKSKDGVEKRFKDADSDEAKAWKEQTAKKATVKFEKYSQPYWDREYEKSEFDEERVWPWDIVTRYDLEGDDLAAAFEASGHNIEHVDSWDYVRKGHKIVNGVDCAGAVVRMTYFYTKDDDIGIDGDEPVSDSQNILVVRNPKDPKKLIFGGFA